MQPNSQDDIPTWINGLDKGRIIDIPTNGIFKLLANKLKVYRKKGTCVGSFDPMINYSPIERRMLANRLNKFNESLTTSSFACKFKLNT